MSHQPLADHVEAAKAHLDQHGYCIVENAISRAEAAALRTRLTSGGAGTGVTVHHSRTAVPARGR